MKARLSRDFLGDHTQPEPDLVGAEAMAAKPRRLVAPPSHWPSQQLCNVPLQMVVGGKADRVFHVLGDQLSVERGQPGKVSACVSTSVSNDSKREVKATPRS